MTARAAARAQDAPGPGGPGPGPQAKARTSSDADIRRLRLDKAQALRQAGLEPYAYTYDRTAAAAELQAAHAGLSPGQADEAARVRVAGRVMLRRVMGRLAFARLEDSSGAVQLYFDRGVLDPEAWARLKDALDIGDIIGAQGLPTCQQGIGLSLPREDVLAAAAGGAWLPAPAQGRGPFRRPSMLWPLAGRSHPPRRPFPWAPLDPSPSTPPTAQDT